MEVDLVILILGFRYCLVFRISDLEFVFKRGDKNRLTILNHMSYNNLTF
jgi:hypothetical protein